ncbi:hypothetical protein BBH99_11825 [Chryseobacterium contaminans]|uniref:Uncharacterized protein n=1 Tax=Chryseobacterium contaminans TaxID=1423959 RepID=A0A1M7INQ0_9FLAO|nr:hypothetical protein [Chryseobacterium contaminans]OCA76874.1 hypothetical protein BBH99_11825 [Chryseobacterium contaminans]SHM42243.1 hypothetical protein SAMN05444407_11614 [Chryseobacterium contaminans]
MKKLLYSFLILSSATLFAQKKLAVADNMIGTEDLFKSASPRMQVLKVYNTAASLPANLKKYSSVFTNGVSVYKLNKNNGFDKMSLAQLNKQINIPADNPVFIDGYEFTDSSTKIFTAIIAKTEKKDYNGKPTYFIYTTK